MLYPTFTSNGVTYEPNSDGTYTATSVVVGGPLDEIKVRPGKVANNGNRSTGLMLRQQFADSVTGQISGSVTVDITFTVSGRTPNPVPALKTKLGTLNDFAVEAILQKMLLGRQ